MGEHCDRNISSFLLFFYSIINISFFPFVPLFNYSSLFLSFCPICSIIHLSIFISLSPYSLKVDGHGKHCLYPFVNLFLILSLIHLFSSLSLPLHLLILLSISVIGCIFNYPFIHLFSYFSTSLSPHSSKVAVQ